MRWTKVVVVLSALVSVPGCDDGEDRRDARLDSGVADAGICATVTMCLDGAPTQVDDVCIGLAIPTGMNPSAGLYHVCQVDPRGRLLLFVLRGDQVVTNSGWTHSASGNGLVPSTLSAADEARCTQARAALSAADAGVAVCRAP